MELDTKIIETELVKASITDQVISKMKEDFMPLKVKDVYDKVGFEAVTTARKEVKKFRVLVEKVLKVVRQPATDFQKAVIAKEKDIVSRISEVEDYLISQEDIFNRKDEIQMSPEDSDTDKLLSLAKSLLAIKLPELNTDDAKNKVIKVKVLLDQAVNILK